MQRSVQSEIAFTALPGRSQIPLMIAVAEVPGLTISDSLDVEMDGEPVQVVPLGAPHHGRIHLLGLEAQESEPRQVQVRYRATIEGDPAGAAEQGIAPSTTELLTYLRPSRYAESDRLLPTARSLFDGATGLELLQAVGEYVQSHLAYVPGSSRVTDGAVQTLLDRRGVCRDYAHLVVALLRGLDVPARCAAVYAPGLAPMDFHAVAEAWVDDRWHVVDASRLAPRQSLIRIATGRDAADNAFLSAYGAGIQMGEQAVTATVQGELPRDDHSHAVHLA